MYSALGNDLYGNKCLLFIRSPRQVHTVNYTNGAWKSVVEERAAATELELPPIFIRIYVYIYWTLESSSHHDQLMMVIFSDDKCRNHRHV